MARRVIFRADGNSRIGIGHIVRSLALAEILKPHFDIYFAIREPSARICDMIREQCSGILTPPNRAIRDESWLLPLLESSDLVVLDGYHFTERDQKMLRQAAAALVMIEDLPDRHIFADVLISHGAGIHSDIFTTEPYTQQYLGLDYALLRQPFREAPGPLKQKIPGDPARFFISFGGADPLDLSRTLLDACKGLPEIREIHIVTSSANLKAAALEEYAQYIENKQVRFHQNLDARSMCRLMQRCGRGFTSASGVSIEACAAGMQLFTGFYTEDQKSHARALRDQGLALFGGDLRGLFPDQIRTAMIRDFQNFEVLQKQQDRFGGQQSLNLLKIFHPWISN